jgi:DNA-binding MurR/RpiR family transcriptional regulator
MALRPNSAAQPNFEEETVIDRLQREIEELPNALARIAKYVLENPEKVASSRLFRSRAAMSAAPSSRFTIAPKAG